MERFIRTEKLLGDLTPLSRAHVAVFGIGGVGGYCAEALARGGVGAITLCDGDAVAESNINRQIIAMESTVGRNKAAVMAERIRDINGECETVTAEYFATADNLTAFDGKKIDYIADCIDRVTDKLDLIEYAYRKGIDIISCMGAGNKLVPSFLVADIYETSVCPLARVVRTELKKRGVDKLKTVYSRESPVIRTREPASVSFVPPVAGMVMASEIIKDLLGKEKI